MTLNAKIRIVTTVAVDFKGDSYRSWSISISRTRKDMLPIRPIRRLRKQATVRTNWVGQSEI
jgi:hypothetical protein